MTEDRVLVAGESLIDFIPDRQGTLAEVEGFTRRAGGAPANVAVALATLGDPPLFWTRVGDDPFGDHLVETLGGAGIPDQFVERDPEARTSLAFVSHDEDADRAFTFYRDDTADTRFESGAVPDETLGEAEWVHAGGVTLADEPARTATLDLMERAAEADCTVSFDPNVRPELWANETELATVCGWAIDETDVLKATPDELRALGIEGADPEVLARSACDRGPHTTLLTLGSEGSVAVATDDAPWSGSATHGGFDADPVDTTGAGDAFTAGAIDSLVRGADLGDALVFANAVAAATTTAKGAMAALPDRSEVQQLLE